MLLDLLAEKEQMTPQEEAVADYILNHLDQMVGLSAEELARLSYTSKATVIRLGQKLGLAGYQAFKFKLIAEINQRKRLEQVLAREPIHQGSSYEDLLRTLPHLYDKVMTNTGLSLDKEQLERICRYIREADQLVFYGTGVTYHLAQVAAFKFETLGYETKVYESLNQHYLRTKKASRSVTFVISYTGANEHITQMAAGLKSLRQRPIIGLLGPHHQTLASYCHEVIELSNRDDLLSLDVISSSMALTYVLDFLFVLLLAEGYDRHVAAVLPLLPDPD